MNKVHRKFPLDMCLICLKFFCNKMLFFGLVFVLFYIRLSGSSGFKTTEIFKFVINGNQLPWFVTSEMFVIGKDSPVSLDGFFIYIYCFFYSLPLLEGMALSVRVSQIKPNEKVLGSKYHFCPQHGFWGRANKALI